MPLIFHDAVDVATPISDKNRPRRASLISINSLWPYGFSMEIIDALKAPIEYMDTISDIRSDNYVKILF